MGRGSSGGDGHCLSAAIGLSPAGDLCSLLRRPSCFCAEGGRQRSPELPRRSNDSAASILVGQAARWPRPAQLCIRDHFSAGRSGVRGSAERHWPSLRRRSWATIKAPRRTRSAPGGDAALARVQLGLGGRRGLIGRSRCPTRRCTGRSPRASAQNTKAHWGLGRRCIIGLPFRASPVNGRALDAR